MAATRSEAAEVFILGAGDIRHSLGTRSQFLGLVATLVAQGLAVHALFLQAYLPDLGERGVSDGDETWGTCVTFERPTLWRVLPRAVFRFLEKVWGLGQAVGRLPALRRASVVLVTGDLYPLLPFLGRWLPNTVYFKFGIVEELALSSGGHARLRAWWVRFAEQRMLAGVGRVAVVSEGMRRYLLERNPFPASRILVVPCLVDIACFRYDPSARMEIRRKRGWADRLVFVYAGISAPWQCIDETFAIFRMIRQMVPRAFLWVVTPDVRACRARLTDVAEDDCAIETLPHRVLGEVLQAADCGFLIRRRSIVNAVASPLKFAEYLAGGVPVLTGPEVGDYSALTVKEDVGAVLDPADQRSWTTTLPGWCRRLPEEREGFGRRCRSVAERVLSWQSAAGDLPTRLDVPLRRAR